MQTASKYGSTPRRVSASRKPAGSRSPLRTATVRPSPPVFASAVASASLTISTPRARTRSRSSANVRAADSAAMKRCPAARWRFIAEPLAPPPITGP